jgi:histidinol-phosphate/aromatic aminotransferase/cobyric acid decarboxylase-like protein
MLRERINDVAGCSSNDVWIVVDGAYADFSGDRVGSIVRPALATAPDTEFSR